MNCNMHLLQTQPYHTKIKANIKGIINLNKGEPFLGVLDEDLVYGVRGNPPILHLGDDVLQDVGIAMTSILYLGNNRE